MLTYHNNKMKNLMCFIFFFIQLLNFFTSYDDKSKEIDFLFISMNIWGR